MSMISVAPGPKCAWISSRLEAADECLETGAAAGREEKAAFRGAGPAVGNAEGPRDAEVERGVGAFAAGERCIEAGEQVGMLAHPGLRDGQEVRRVDQDAR